MKALYSYHRQFIKKDINEDTRDKMGLFDIHDCISRFSRAS